MSHFYIGGQFFSTVPRDKPLDPSSSLISFNDFFPRFGVFNKSISDLCIKSPIKKILSAFKQFVDLTVNSSSSIDLNKSGSKSYLSFLFSLLFSLGHSPLRSCLGAGGIWARWYRSASEGCRGPRATSTWSCRGPMRLRSMFLKRQPCGFLPAFGLALRRVWFKHPIHGA